MQQDTDQSKNGRLDEPVAARETTENRYTVHEAALLLGLSVDAVRKRAERGSLKREKDPDGTVYIILDTDHKVTSHEENAASQQGSGDESSANQGTLVATLQDQIDYLRSEMDVRNEELRRKDHLLAAALERIPEIEPSKAANEPPATEKPGAKAAEDEGGGEGAPSDTQDPTPKRSLLYRFFFGT